MSGKNQEFITMEQMGNYLFADSEPIETAEDPRETIFEDDAPQEGQEEQEDSKDESAEADSQSVGIDGVATEELPTGVKKTELSSVVKSFIKDEIWQDFQVEHDGVTYDSLADLVDAVEVTEEIFKGIVATQTKSEIDKVKEKAIIVDKTVDPTRRKLAEAIASGLKDYEPFVKSYDNIIEPLKDMDLSVEQNAVALLADYYKNVHMFDDEYIQFKIDQHIKNKDVVTTAEDVRKETISGYEEILKKKEEEQKAEEKEREAEISQSKKSFKDKLKEMSYGDPFISKAIPLMFAKDSGEEHWIKEIRNRISTDEDFKVEFSHWLLDTKDYINKKISPLKREEKLKSINLLNVIGAASKKSTPKPEEEDFILNIKGQLK